MVRIGMPYGEETKNFWPRRFEAMCCGVLHWSIGKFFAFVEISRFLPEICANLPLQLRPLIIFTPTGKWSCRRKGGTHS